MRIGNVGIFVKDLAGARKFFEDYFDATLLKTYNEGAPVFAHKKTPRRLAEEIKENLEVVTPGISTPVRQLSGGNVQKVLVGREIAQNPAVLMTAYAVRGLDINASYTIYDLINKQKKAGVAVVYVDRKSVV